MPAAPATVDEFLELVRKSSIVEGARFEAYLGRLDGAMPAEPQKLAALFARDGLLTLFQAEQLLQGKWRGFTIGKYRILDRLGSGGMGVVYLAEHTLMRRRVALKILPLPLAQDRWFLERFYREAEAVAALDHANIVHAHDIDHEGRLHYLVMEYVDGSSLQEIVQRRGPFDSLRAAHYIRQAALGLQHAHKSGLIHRDIKPGNLLLDRQGTIKILDMGLACFSQERARGAALGSSAEKRTLGTDDYLAPEQIVDSDEVDGRADIYSLGATFYFLLTGKPPFDDVASGYHKLIGHLARRPRPLAALRPEVPEELAAMVDKMLAKNPWDRYQTAAEVAETLVPWTKSPIPPPPAEEMPPPNRATRRSRPPSAGAIATLPGSSPGKSWVVCSGTTDAASSSGVLSDPAICQDGEPATVSWARLGAGAAGGEPDGSEKRDPASGKADK